MKKFLIIAIPFVMGLSACTGPLSNWVNVRNEKFGVRFSHPAAWGAWSLSSLPSQENTDVQSEMIFTNLDPVDGSPPAIKSHVNVLFRKYDDTNNRYEEVCESIHDLCDTMKKQDLLEEKDSFLRKADQSIAGMPATIRDYYDVPSAHLIREVWFYTSKYRVRLNAMYDIGSFLEIRRKDQDHDLVSVAVKILGKELKDPIHRLNKMYPEELKDMIKFYHDVDLFLASIKVHDEESRK